MAFGEDLVPCQPPVLLVGDGEVGGDWGRAEVGSCCARVLGEVFVASDEDSVWCFREMGDDVCVVVCRNPAEHDDGAGEGGDVVEVRARDGCEVWVAKVPLALRDGTLSRSRCH
eukprot:259717-Rhodomonas_salina.1